VEIVARVRRQTLAEVNDENREQMKDVLELVRQVLEAQRAQLFQIRTEGTCSSEGLKSALARIDAVEMSLARRSEH
jgi:aspartate aminotransferase-like enzyme